MFPTFPKKVLMVTFFMVITQCSTVYSMNEEPENIEGETVLFRTPHSYNTMFRIADKLEKTTVTSKRAEKLCEAFGHCVQRLRHVRLNHLHIDPHTRELSKADLYEKLWNELNLLANLEGKFPLSFIKRKEVEALDQFCFQTFPTLVYLSPALKNHTDDV